MKTKFKSILLILPLSLSFLTSCNETKVESLPSYLNTFLNEARKSYTLESDEKEFINKKEDDSLIVSNDYYFDAKLISGKEGKVYQNSYFIKDEETFEEKFTYVKDDRGFVCKEALDYKNEVIKKPILLSGKKVSFDSTFFNPFNYININDFKKIDEDDVYLLNLDKALTFTNYLYGNEAPIEEVKFTFKDEVLKDIKVLSKTKEGVFLDQNTNLYINVNYHYETIVLLKDLNKTTIEGVKPVQSRNKEKENILKTALDGLGKNFTIIINEHDRETPSNPEYDNVWYFNGVDKVYHQHSSSDESKKYDLYYKSDEATFGDNLLRYYDYESADKGWEYSEPYSPQSYNANPQPYEYFLPKNDSIAPELFNYDEKANKYICDATDVLGYIGNNFLPGCFPISYFTNGEGDKCEITLNSDNKIKQIVVGFSRVYDGFVLETDFDMMFLNIGTTEIPNWVEE